MNTTVRRIHAQRLLSALSTIPKLVESNRFIQTPEFQDWRERVEQGLETIFGVEHPYVDRFTRLRFWSERVELGWMPVDWTDQDQRIFESDLLRAHGIIKDAVDEFEALDAATAVDKHTSQASETQRTTSPIVFIGHGRSPLWIRVQQFLEKDLNLEVVAFESESHAGEHIIEILANFLDRASFAVLVLTAEDATQDGALRARQNVIHEAGLFQGKLGFRRAILLVEEGVEEFSNVAGLQQIGFPRSQIHQTFFELGRVLKREGVSR